MSLIENTQDIVIDNIIMYLVEDFDYYSLLNMSMTCRRMHNMCSKYFDVIKNHMIDHLRKLKVIYNNDTKTLQSQPHKPLNVSLSHSIYHGVNTHMYRIMTNCLKTKYIPTILTIYPTAITSFVDVFQSWRKRHFEKAKSLADSKRYLSIIDSFDVVDKLHYQSVPLKNIILFDPYNECCVQRTQVINYDKKYLLGRCGAYYNLLVFDSRTYIKVSGMSLIQTFDTVYENSDGYLVHDIDCSYIFEIV